jgi:hypothetical protein
MDEELLGILENELAELRPSPIRAIVARRVESRIVRRRLLIGALRSATAMASSGIFLAAACGLIGHEAMAVASGRAWNAQANFVVASDSEEAYMAAIQRSPAAFENLLRRNLLAAANSPVPPGSPLWRAIGESARRSMREK